MKLPIVIIPQEVIEHYSLIPLVHNKHVYIQISKGMYGLAAQSGFLAHQALIKHLQPFGYSPVRFTPGLWHHSSRPIWLSLVVDDFGIKFTHKSDAIHLLNALKLKYTLSTDWSGSAYCGISLKWSPTFN